MRCPNCQKFTAMENGEPQFDNWELTYDKDSQSFHVSAELRHTRNCADCLDELKEYCESLEADISVDELSEVKPDEREALKAKLAEGDEEPEVDASDGESEESGGGRYKKNLIRCWCDFAIKLDDKVLHNGQLSTENAASSYDECC